jgi:hypothetical protein
VVEGQHAYAGVMHLDNGLKDGLKVEHCACYMKPR